MPNCCNSNSITCIFIQELNVDQVQSQILNKIRVVWKGAQIPIWLSDFVSVYIKIGTSF